MRRQLADGSTIRNQKFVVEYFCRPDNCKTGHFHVVKRMTTATKMSKSEKINALAKHGKLLFFIVKFVDL